MPHSEAGGELSVLTQRSDAIPLAVGGLPSPESIFTIHCVSEIVRRTQGQVNVIPFNTGDDAERMADANSGEPTIPFFDTPDGRAREALLATQAPIVLIAGDFTETARFCMVARDLDALQAARFVSQSFSCLEPLYRHDGVRCVAVDRKANLADWIDQVAAWLDLQPSTWQTARQQMLSDYAAWPTAEAAIHALVEFADTASADREQLPTATLALFETLGRCYRSGWIDSIVWPADSILEPGEPAFPVADAISLTGPARMLTFGPFLHLPPGHWNARYHFEVDQHLAGNLMEFDIVNGTNVLVSHRVLVEGAGKFGFDCEFDMQESRLPVENRAILAEGSIGGFFRPAGIWLNRDRPSVAQGTNADTSNDQ
ncbi:hypothetical protein [Sphingomonas sp.]|uniref:hypothetical protein n=1 Tax=Sphingomonas sp. TaxID=28214 RepID=UPI0025E78313|nr:hypothetical protein [Sphingomonas sp.]